MLGKKQELGENREMREYVEKVDDTYRLSGSRVSLDSIVFAFLRGASPESIQRSFPTIELETVYGAVAYYLANQEEIDKYLAQGDAEFAALEHNSRTTHGAWYSRLQQARKDSRVS